MPTAASSLTVIGTHPVQYQAPVYDLLMTRFGIPVIAIYGSDFSIAGGYDTEFQTDLAWDNISVDTNRTVFLSRAMQGGAKSFEEVRTCGLAAAISRLHTSAVLLTGYQPSFHLRAFWEVKKRQFPILFRAETTDHTNNGGLLKRTGKDVLLRYIYAHCARLLPLGVRSRAHYRRLGCPEEKLVQSPYCVDTSVFSCDEASRSEMRQPVRSQFGIGPEQITLLFSGKFIPRKAPQLLVAAAKSLPDEIRRRVVVMFMGSGNMERQLQELAETEPYVGIAFTGFQNQSQLSRFYHAADLMVLPSYSETWGLVVNEALHHGVPCIVTEGVGCAPDLIEPGITGEIAETGSSASLAVAIRRGISLVGRKEIRARCRERVNSFTPMAAAEGIAKAFWSVVEPSRCVNPS